MVTREEMMARKDEWVARKDEIAERFVDTATDPVVDSALALSLVGAGAATVIVSAVRRERGVLGYLVGMVFVLAGILVMSGALKERSGRISDAEVEVRAQLATLDPIARAQVLKDMAGETVAPFVRRGQPAAE